MKSTRLVSIRMPDESVLVVPRSDFEAICDFCSAACVPLTLHSAHDVPLAAGMSVGDWAACDECTRWIYRIDKEALLSRALTVFTAKYGPRAALAVEIAHAAFWTARSIP